MLMSARTYHTITTGIIVSFLHRTNLLLVSERVRGKLGDKPFQAVLLLSCSAALLTQHHRLTGIFCELVYSLQLGYSISLCQRGTMGND